MTNISLNGKSVSGELVQKLMKSNMRNISASSYELNSRESRNIEVVKNAQKYKEFKDAVLSDILRRGIFTDRVIKDSFYREIERRTDLDLVCFHFNISKQLRYTSDLIVPL